MKMITVGMLLLCSICLGVSGVIISPFRDTDAFVERAKDIVVAECTSIPAMPPQVARVDGLYVVEVNILKVLKGNRKPGPLRIVTIYPMDRNITYMLCSLGGNALGTDFLAIPELSVVPLPRTFRIGELEGKAPKEQVHHILSRRLYELERQLAQWTAGHCRGPLRADIRGIPSRRRGKAYSAARLDSASPPANRRRTYGGLACT